jgi:hypothetical protein
VSDQAADRAASILDAASYLRGPLRLSSHGIVGVAAVMRVEPGRYALTAGADERARWVRLRRSGL